MILLLLLWSINLESFTRRPWISFQSLPVLSLGFYRFDPVTYFSCDSPTRKRKGNYRVEMIEIRGFARGYSPSESPQSNQSRFDRLLTDEVANRNWNQRLTSTNQAIHRYPLGCLFVFGNGKWELKSFRNIRDTQQWWSDRNKHILSNNDVAKQDLSTDSSPACVPLNEYGRAWH